MHDGQVQYATTKDTAYALYGYREWILWGRLTEDYTLLEDLQERVRIGVAWPLEPSDLRSLDHLLTLIEAMEKDHVQSRHLVAEP